MNPFQRILAIDFGKKRIGLAISDPMMITAQPLATVEYRSVAEVWKELDAILTEYSVQKIVLGLPKNMNGSEGEAAANVKKFAEKIKTRYSGIDICFWDERLTSQEAERTLRTAGKKPSRMKPTIDKIAALFILQGYLDRHQVVRCNESD